MCDSLTAAQNHFNFALMRVLYRNTFFLVKNALKNIIQ